MDIVIAGAGAMGATYGSILSKKENKVVFLDMWQENIDAINSKMCRLNNLGVEEKYMIKAYLPKEYTKIPELIILLTKSNQLENMLENISHIIGENTYVLCLLNGLGHIETIKKYVKEDKILMGVSVMTAQSIKAGSFKVSNYGKTEIQNICNTKEAKDFSLKLVDNLNKVGLMAEYSENIMYSIWRKACLNGTMNASCSILECNLNELNNFNNLKEFFKQIVSEFAFVAEKQNTILDVDNITEMLLSFTTEKFAGYLHYPSMYQDLIVNKRKTEVDFLNGYVAKETRKYNKRAFYCELITELIHAKENLIRVK